MQLNEWGEIVPEQLESPIETTILSIDGNETPVTFEQAPTQSNVTNASIFNSFYNYECQQQVIKLNNEVIYAHSPAKVAEVLEKFAEITPQNDEEVKAFFLSHQ